MPMKAHASFLAVLVACASAPPRPVVPTISPPLLAVPTVPSHPSEIRAFVTVPIDYSENIRVLVEELRNRVPAVATR